MTPANFFALLATMICALAAIGLAKAVAARPENHRLFVSLTLFALTWTILLPYYALQAEPVTSVEIAHVRNFFPAYSGVLLLFAGGALYREAVERKNQHKNMAKFDIVALICLGLLAAPHIVAFAPQFVFLEPAFVNLLDVILAFFGLGSIIVGLRMLTTEDYNSPWLSWAWNTIRKGDAKAPWLWRTLLGVVLLYFVLDAVHEFILFSQTFHSPKTIGPMHPFLMWAFAALKLAFSFTFFAMIRRQVHPPDSIQGGGTPLDQNVPLHRGQDHSSREVLLAVNNLPIPSGPAMADSDCQERSSTVFGKEREERRSCRESHDNRRNRKLEDVLEHTH